MPEDVVSVVYAEREPSAARTENKSMANGDSFEMLSAATRAYSLLQRAITIPSLSYDALEMAYKRSEMPARSTS